MLHSSCVVVDGAAYAFSADSGTGKSTHTALWLKHFGNRAYMLNDDKPAIRLVGDRVYACRPPGAENMITPPQAWFPWRAFASWSGRRRILSTRQTPKRQCSTFSPKRCASWPNAMERLFDMLETIFAKGAPQYELGCNISDDAVRTSYNAMKPKDQSEK